MSVIKTWTFVIKLLMISILTILPSHSYALKRASTLNLNLEPDVCLPNAEWRSLRRDAEKLPTYESSYSDCTGDIINQPDPGMNTLEAIGLGSIMVFLGYLAGKYGK